jgi:hypothetical protein
LEEAYFGRCAVIRGPGKSGGQITADDYLQERIAANYAK